MKIFELQSGDIDNQLKKISGGINKKAPDDQEEQISSTQNDPQVDQSDQNSGVQEPQNQPDLPPGLDSGDVEQEKIKKVDQDLVSSMSGHPYASDYDHSEDSPSHPFNIIQMNLDELQQSRTVVRNKISKIVLSDKSESLSDPRLKFYQDMITFIDKTIEYRKQATKIAEPERQPPKAKKISSPKTKAGEYKAPKNKNQNRN